jgi:hypothetical protein
MMNFDTTYWNNLKIKYQATNFTKASPILELMNFANIKANIKLTIVLIYL